MDTGYTVNLFTREVCNLPSYSTIAKTPWRGRAHLILLCGSTVQRLVATPFMAVGMLVRTIHIGNHAHTLMGMIELTEWENTVTARFTALSLDSNVEWCMLKFGTVIPINTFHVKKIHTFYDTYTITFYDTVISFKYVWRTFLIQNQHFLLKCTINIFWTHGL